MSRHSKVIDQTDRQTVMKHYLSTYAGSKNKQKKSKDLIFIKLMKINQEIKKLLLDTAEANKNTQLGYSASKKFST